MQYINTINNQSSNKKIVIFGCGFTGRGIASYLKDIHMDFECFCDNNPNKIGHIVMNKKVITLDELLLMEDVNVIIGTIYWQNVYDQISSVFNDDSIFIIDVFWRKTSEPCIVCENKSTLTTYAFFAPFLIERMFQGNDVNTSLVHCPNCGVYYSKYRPNDEETSRLYTNYRDDYYQKQREIHEKNYTKKFNESLFAPVDGGEERKNGMADFIKDTVDFKKCQNLLDFGGDKGQFIPDYFNNTNKFVYEISGADVLPSITLIKNKEELENYRWDFIMCCHVMEHLSDIKGYFSELVKLLSKDSILYIEVPYETYIENTSIPIIHEHINFYREKTLIKLAEMKNLKVIKVETKDVIRCLFKRV